MKRNTLIKGTLACVFGLSWLLCTLMDPFRSPDSSKLFCLTIAVLGILAIVGEILFCYVILPPIKDDDDTNND